MSITDELREWAHGFNGPWKRNEETLLAIADRIDAEHKKELADVWDSIGDESVMAENGWVRLPRDSEGEYIHVGDKLDGYKETIVVDEMALQYGSWALVSDDRRAFHCPEAFTHHKATVEDVLREFAQEMNENLGMYTGEAIDADEWRDADAKTVTKYAERIREAVEHE